MERPVRARMWEDQGRWHGMPESGSDPVEIVAGSQDRCVEALRSAAGDPPAIVVEVTPAIVGIAEVAEIMGWDKRRVVTYLDRGSFPEPFARLASGRIWRRSDIEAFQRTWRARYEAKRAGKPLPVEVEAPEQAETQPGSTGGGASVQSADAGRLERRILLIRHGRADRGSAARFATDLGPQWDPPLDDVGREQADLLATRLLQRDPPAAVYSSTLARARQTAHAYADRANLPVSERDELAEWFSGDWEGKTFESIFDEHPDAAELFRAQDPAWHLAPGSEAADAFQERVVTAIEGIIAAHPSGDLFVFAHGGVINAYVAHVLGMERRELFFLPENTSLNTIVIRGTERRTWFLSDASHLTDPSWFGQG